MKILLDDTQTLEDFYPLTLTRPVGNLRMGILTNDERWNRLVPECRIGWLGKHNDLSGKYPSIEGGIHVNANVIPNRDVVEAIATLEDGEQLMMGEVMIASKSGGKTETIEYSGESPMVINHRWELFQKNGAVLKADFELITAGRASQSISSSNTVLGDPSLIFIEEGAKVEASILNTNSGPIYIGTDAEIMEGCIVRGPFAMVEHSVLKMGAKIYGPTTLGPFCKVGGEVNNCVFYGYSNKGHDGFLGNSLIGEWCNLGADTNTSNLKNNYSPVKTYSYRTEKQELTDVQFMGLTMGDHSKCGINTMFNTASVVGVSCNVYGGDFPNKFLPSFSWGVDGDRFDFDKAVEAANNMMKRRAKELSTDELAILRHIADR